MQKMEEGQQPDSTPSEVVDTTETPNTTETPVVVTEQKEEVTETQKEETKNESKDWVKKFFLHQILQCILHG